MKKLSLATALALLLFVALAAQRRDTVFLEDLTWAEVRDLITAGTTTVIVGTAGTEQKGPHMVDGEHKFVMEYAGRQNRARARQDARRAGRHLRARRQLGAPGRTHGQARHDHAAGGSLRRVARQRRPQPEGRRIHDDPVPRRVRRQPHAACARRPRGSTSCGRTARGHSGSTTTTPSRTPIRTITSRKTLGIPADQIGGHANILDTSELLFVNPKHVRMNEARAGGGYENSGVSGDPTKSTPAIGKALLQIKIDNAARADQRR